MRKTILAVILLLFLCGQAWGATYYVTESGSGDGSSARTPDSLSDFNGGVFGELDGDTVYFLDNFTSPIRMPDGGATSSPVTIRFDYEGREGSVRDCLWPLRLKSHSNITIVGAYPESDIKTFSSAAQDSIYQTGAMHNITIRNIYSHGPERRHLKLNQGGSNLVIKDSLFVSSPETGAWLEGFDEVTIENCTFDGFGLEGTGNYEGINVNDCYNKVLVSDCVFKNGDGGDGSAGIDMNPSATPSPMNATITHCLFKNNQCKNGGAYLKTSGVDHAIYVEYSVFINNRSHIATNYTNNNDLHVFNCVFYNSTKDFFLEFRPNSGTNHLTFKNNIISGDGDSMWFDDTYSTLVSDYNCWDIGEGTAMNTVDGATWSEWQRQGYGAHSLGQDVSPLFVDPAGEDFRLKADSPCVGEGTAISDLHDQSETLLDYYGNPVPSNPSIGIHEPGIDEPLDPPVNLEIIYSD